MIDRARLRELAAAATPGPWTAYCRDVGWREGTPWPADRFLQWDLEGPPEPDGRGQFYEPDARYIAAASPDAIIALLDALDSAERERDSAAEAQRAAETELAQQMARAAMRESDVRAERDALAALLQRARTALADMDRACDRDLIDAIDALDGAKGE